MNFYKILSIYITVLYETEDLDGLQLACTNLQDLYNLAEHLFDKAYDQEE